MKTIGRIARIARVGRAGAVPVPHGQAEFTSAGSGTWTVPTGVTRVVMEAWGSGSDGDVGSQHGGGGGSFARAYVNVTPGDHLPYNVGANVPFSGFPSDDSYVLPVGGTHGVDDLVSAGCGAGAFADGTGGVATVGDDLHNGGDGGVGLVFGPGGGGGGCAGPGSDGGIGGDAVLLTPGPGGTGGDPHDDNHGGVGGLVSADGAAGAYPGGGGGGAGSGGNAGAGAAGRIRITWPV